MNTTDVEAWRMIEAIVDENKVQSSQSVAQLARALSGAACKDPQAHACVGQVQVPASIRTNTVVPSLQASGLACKGSNGDFIASTSLQDRARSIQDSRHLQASRAEPGDIGRRGPAASKRMVLATRASLLTKLQQVDVRTTRHLPTPHVSYLSQVLPKQRKHLKAGELGESLSHPLQIGCGDRPGLSSVAACYL
ncbi:hypothetical protein OPT61_g2289 [Boeremia exigua]|uniref:Uncharacterized protein n=1 Tax=Boeremia exigua TaxID=749465 RepID=A0ACC2IMB8_9PLEO|nr:hypothetical protein OPT61_g2289 [Boeremia exigua]